jgi:glycerol-3-phosphate dehydrogenase subunit C
MEFKQGNVSTSLIQLTETDRNGKLASFLAPFVNWFTSRRNKIARFIMEFLTGVDRNSELPRYHHKTFGKRNQSKREINGLAAGRKAVLYSTCFINYNNPGIGEATQKVLSNHGVETKILYPSCCGMPQLEQGNISRVAENAQKVAAEILPWVDNGYDVIALVPSCALMLKFEWPLILPENQDIKKLGNATFDVSEYIMDMARQKQLQGGLKKIEGGVTIHLACHSRAQNMGPKAADMLRLIPDTKVSVVERCSGHGGSWGIMKSNFETALRVGEPAAKKAVASNHGNVVSECPLAREHIVQGMKQMGKSNSLNDITSVSHPIEILAKSFDYG